MRALLGSFVGFFARKTQVNCGFAATYHIFGMDLNTEFSGRNLATVGN
jgi:hypothetical protein